MLIPGRVLRCVGVVCPSPTASRVYTPYIICYFVLSQLKKGDNNACRFGEVCSRCADKCGSVLEEGATLKHSMSLPYCEAAPEGTTMPTRGNHNGSMPTSRSVFLFISVEYVRESGCRCCCYCVVVVVSTVVDYPIGLSSRPASRSQ